MKTIIIKTCLKSEFRITPCHHTLPGEIKRKNEKGSHQRTRKYESQNLKMKKLQGEKKNVVVNI